MPRARTTHAKPTNAREICHQATPEAPAVRALRSRSGSALIEHPDDPQHTKHPEQWVTKQQLADHLQVTRRWIEYQQHLGLPYLRLGAINRYRLSEVEAWLRQRNTPPDTPRGAARAGCPGAHPTPTDRESRK